jgi:hypothetical protein
MRASVCRQGAPRAAQSPRRGSKTPELVRPASVLRRTTTTSIPALVAPGKRPDVTVSMHTCGMDQLRCILSTSSILNAVHLAVAAANVEEFGSGHRCVLGTGGPASEDCSHGSRLDEPVGLPISPSPVLGTKQFVVEGTSNRETERLLLAWD